MARIYSWVATSRCGKNDVATLSYSNDDVCCTGRRQRLLGSTYSGVLSPPASSLPCNYPHPVPAAWSSLSPFPIPPAIRTPLSPLRPVPSPTTSPLLESVSRIATPVTRVPPARVEESESKAYRAAAPHAPRTTTAPHKARATCRRDSIEGDQGGAVLGRGGALCDWLMVEVW
ncbi:hypothetical protein E2C01_089096 [Portunus trituberculatus]|uniref:Uncharacterized protein n=1 Tax=Portunus trituberculatus TaxID=210409 RepID=A0A5B7JLL1_PORTR|nr:hypothetical protein [Portunus trituberculatus]